MIRTRVQAIVVRHNRILMVRHRHKNRAHWCLPGGGWEMGETLEECILRELQEECCLQGVVLRQVSHWIFVPGDHTITFLVDIQDQEPALGYDPELSGEAAILVDVRFLRLDEIPERDRAFLWAAGLVCVEEFLSQVISWGDEVSYPQSERHFTDSNEI